ncbi:MAG: hypothetical protein WCJ67_04905 [Thermoleophilia bacterium]
MEAERQSVKDNGEGSGGGKKAPIRVGAVIAIALLVAFVAWIVIDRSGGDSATTATTTTAGPTGATAVGPVAATDKVLSALASNAGHVVYWAGPVEGTTPEFTQTSKDLIYVRYLPAGVAVGTQPLKYLIVATYPFVDGYNALKKISNGNGVEIPGGGFAVVDERQPRSVHFAFPDVDFQGEIFDVTPEKALEVATSGDIQPVPLP